MKKYYKVTTKLKGEQYSYIMYGNKAGVKYVLGKWVKPQKWLAKEGYGLFVFDNEINAQNFILGLPQKIIKVWECKVKGKYKKLPIYLSSENLNKGKLEPSKSRKDFPLGTVMVKKVKLTKLIWENKNE